MSQSQILKSNGIPSIFQVSVLAIALLGAFYVLVSTPTQVLASTELVPETAWTGFARQNSITADSSDTPYIFSDYGLYRKTESGWIRNQVLPGANGANCYNPFVLLDHSNKLHMFYQQYVSGNDYRLYHSECASTLLDGESCEEPEEIVTRPDDNPDAPEFGRTRLSSSVEDIDGNLHLVYGYLYGYWGLFYTKRSEGVWSTPTRVHPGTNNEGYMLVDDVHLLLDPDGRTLHVAFNNRSDFQVPYGGYYASKSAAGPWAVEPVIQDSAALQKLAMGLDGTTPLIVYPFRQSDGTYELRLATRSGSSWTHETLYSGATGGIQSIDTEVADGTIHVIFDHGSGSSDDFRPVYVAKELPGGTPRSQRVSDSGFTETAFVSMAYGSSAIHISYSHNRQMLKYIRINTGDDSDGDGIPDAEDNCPNDSNADQADWDEDGMGDVCDDDDDNDNVLDINDNCQFVVNQDQADNDGDNLGDACDTDDDNDNVLDISDNCQFVVNQNQADNDGDNLGDACDDDDDNDEVLDDSDNCPFTANASQDDNDGDGSGDACDDDDDSDGVLDNNDNCPFDPNPFQEDNDLDGDGDVCDPDDDNDGINDLDDNCPITDNPAQDDLDGDNIGDVCDIDIDGDGINNDTDNCELVANVGQEDNDSDGLGDVCDDDDDNDGVLDGDDNCPMIANPDQADNEGDGFGDICDTDDDNDAVPDGEDNCPLIANANQADWDEDGLGDICDDDIDGDDVGNDSDVCQFTPFDEIVDPSTGCSIDQLCPCEGPRGTTTEWKNHGKYVSCIAKSSESFVELGLITEAEKDSIVSEAAQSDCGDK